MEQCRRQKKRHNQISGITLIVLVVTLIVLLLLAGITIGTLFGENGVINKASKAKTGTELAEKEESNSINKMESDMTEKIENMQKEKGWRQPNPLSTEITNGEITLKIGDYVDYTCRSSNARYISTGSMTGDGKSGWSNNQIFQANQYKYGWRVLGIDKDTKQLLLISEDFVPLTGGGSLGNRKEHMYYLSGANGYKNGIDELNKICSIYGTGKGATGARCVNVEDIDWITGYNPENTGVRDKNKTGSGRKYHQGEISEYGNSVKCTFGGTFIEYEPMNGATKCKENASQLHYYDEESSSWKLVSRNSSVTLKSGIYEYYPTTLKETDSNVNSTTGIASTSQEYKMLFTNSSTGADRENSGKTDNFSYWVATKNVATFKEGVNFCFQIVRWGYLNRIHVFRAYGGTNTVCNGIRPVVSLDTEVELKDSGKMQDGCKLYNMSLNK